MLDGKPVGSNSEESARGAVKSLTASIDIYLWIIASAQHHEHRRSVRLLAIEHAFCKCSSTGCDLIFPPDGVSALLVAAELLVALSPSPALQNLCADGPLGRKSCAERNLSYH